MKKIKLLYCLFFMVCPGIIFGQNAKIYLDPRYGHDSISRIECAANLSIINEFMKMDQFDYALPAWRKVFEECPASSRNIYLYGVRMYRSAIESEQNPEQLIGLIDTLMLIYDRRIKNFGQEGLVSGRKGVDLLKYRPEAIQEAYGYLHKSVSLSGKESEEAVLVNLMKTTARLFRDSTILQQVAIDNYNVISDILTRRIASGKVQAEDALNQVKNIFTESGVGDEIGNTLDASVRSGDNDTLKSRALLELNLAMQYAEKEDFMAARKHALEASELRPGWGDPFILLGSLFASSSNICNKDELQQKSVFWIAVDQFIKAKTVDTSMTAKANELINRYTQYFPDAEDAFFYGISEGQEYTVGCWINEKTRVRIRKN